MPYIIDKSKNVVLNNYSYTPPKQPRYQINDLMSVYTHYDQKLGINIPTENKIKGDVKNGKGGI